MINKQLVIKFDIPASQTELINTLINSYMVSETQQTSSSQFANQLPKVANSSTNAAGGAGVYQAGSHNGHHDIVELQISGIKELQLQLQTSDMQSTNPLVQSMSACDTCRLL